MPWTMRWCEDAKKGLKHFSKQWKQETTNCLDNLDTVIQSLDRGTHSEQLKRLLSFIHSEPLGILAIDESGPRGPAKLKALRLYVYAKHDEEILYVLIMGDKRTQRNDINLSKSFVADLIKEQLPGEIASEADEVNDKS